MAKGSDSKGNGEQDSGDKGFPHGSGDYHGKHRAEDHPQSGPLGNRTSQPHAEDGWFPER